MTYGDFKDLATETCADKVLFDKALDIVKIENLMDINLDLLEWFIRLLIKKILIVLSKMQMFLMKNQRGNYTNQLSENSIDNMWGADLADM